MMKKDQAPDAQNTNTDNSTPREESLAERSARLEAEAAAMNDARKDVGYDAQDPLNPTEIDPADIDEPASDDVRLEAMQDELNKAKEQVMRALAEAENARKRAQKDREDASRFAVSGFAKDLLSVADNLRRALDAVPQDLIQGDERIKSLLDGIEATERELLRSFEKNGLQKIEPGEEPFNPNMHEVMFETPGTGKPAGTIIQVMETGYVLNGRLLRPARVGVAKDDGQGDGTPGGTIDTEA